jgi:type IV pilus assembly protein PilO
MTLPLWFEELRLFDWNEFTDSDAIGHWPASVRALLLSLLFCLALGIGYGVFIHGGQNALARAEMETVALHDELQTKSALVASLVAERTRVDAAESAFLAQQSRLSPRAALPALLDALATIAQQSGVTLDELSLREAVAHEFHGEQPLSLVLRGDYHALGLFVDALAALPPLVAPRDFSIERTEKAGVLRIALEASIYSVTDETSSVMEPIVTPIPELIYRAAALRSPFAEVQPVEESVQAREALEAFDLSQLTMTGTLERQGQRWALIRDANGGVTRVGIGARLGRDHGRIVGITRERVELIEEVSDGKGGSERHNSLSLPGTVATEDSAQGAR